MAMLNNYINLNELEKIKNFGTDLDLFGFIENILYLDNVQVNSINIENYDVILELIKHLNSLNCMYIDLEGFAPLNDLFLDISEVYQKR